MGRAALSALSVSLTCALHAAGPAGVGPAVDLSVRVAPFDLPEAGDLLFVAWRDPQASVHAGLLRLEDGAFTAFPVQATAGGVTNLAVGVGGPAEARRAYVGWVDNQLQLQLLVFDARGTVVRPPQPVAAAVQVVPLEIVGAETGARIAHAWDDDPGWDARILSVDLAGDPLALEVAEDVTLGQTLGVATAVGSGGLESLVYTVSGTGLETGPARIRHFGPGGPIGLPHAFASDVQGAYQPYAAVYEPAAALPFLLLGVPFNGPLLGSDLRLAYATLGPGEVLVGASLAELVPAFPGNATDLVGLLGVPERAVVVWQEVEYQDPCACSVPPPVRVEIVAQQIRAGEAPSTEGEPRAVHLWQEGDPAGPPVTLPQLAASTREPGAYTVVWSDGRLRWVTFSPLIFADGFESGDTSAWSAG